MPRRSSRFRRFLRFSTKNVLYFLMILAFLAVIPPLFFHFRLRRFHEMQVKKCGWLDNPPLVCAHGGDSSQAFPNTMDAYRIALLSQVDCIEIDVSRSSDGILLALHDRDLQNIFGNASARVGYLSFNEIKKLPVQRHPSQNIHGQKILTIEAALEMTSGAVKQVILDAKVGPPLYEKGLAMDILSSIKTTQCKECLIWAKSDSLVRDVLKQSQDVTVGYIVMNDPSTGTRSKLLRMKGAHVVGIYHPLIDDKLVKILHGSGKKVYAWTVDDEKSMRKMLVERVDAIITNQPSLLKDVMQNMETQCLQDGFSIAV